MVQIIPEIRKPRFSDQLMQGLASASQEAATEIPRFFGEKMMQAQRAQQQALENEQIQNLISQDIGGIQDPKMRQMIVQQLLQGQQKEGKDLTPLYAGLSTVKKMREIGQRGNLGKTLTRGIFGGQHAKDRAEYEQLGKSLISLASTIPIRNKAEFETLAAKLYDPSIRDAKREGILDAMEHIITQGLQGQSGMQLEESPKERPSLESFHR